jgi:nucleotide-binding universal stress UspA family protein
MPGRPLFETIVVGVDGDHGGRDALALAGRLQRTFGSRVIAALAYPRDPLVSRASSPPYEAVIRDEARETLARELERAVVDAEPKVLSGSSPRRALHRAAEHHEADLIIVGAHRHGLVARVLGRDVTTATLRGAPCPVAVAPRGVTALPQRLRMVAVGFDGSAQSRTALALARDVARTARARLHLIWVVAAAVPVDSGDSRAVAWSEGERAEQERAQTLMAATVAALGDGTTGETVPGIAHQELAQLCHEADLLVVGSRGGGAVRRLLRGSTSTRLVREAACPVLVVPAGFTPHTAAAAGHEAPVVRKAA